jgi:formate-dependent nitrite reductase membrane component NrfD
MTSADADGPGAPPEKDGAAGARADASRQEEQRRAAQARGSYRDMTPATGHGGSPAPWERAVEDASVALHEPGWRDARWSSLFERGDTAYASVAAADPERVVQANRRGRGGEPPTVRVQGPMLKPPVWTWEVPVYFWTGGMAAGASFVALACDLAGDERSARVARRVALGALAPCPPLLILDLGRPERFYNMLRILKPRSPMSTGAWCLSLFGALATAAVGADLLGHRRTAKALGAANAVVGGYLGSYTGVLLACTAVPAWARSRLFLGPIFVSTATLTGASATRLALVATGMAEGHPTREALGRVEGGAMAAELLLSEINEHRLGRLAHAFRDGRSGRWFNAAKWLARTGMALRLARRRGGPWTHHVASGCYMAAALCFRCAWVQAGPISAADEEAVARTARGMAREP